MKGPAHETYLPPPHEMGKVVWPFCSTLTMDDFAELVDDVKRLCLNAVYESWDEVYRDLKLVDNRR